MKYEATDPRAEPGYWYFPVIGLLLVLGISYGLGAIRGQENVKRDLEPHRHAISAAAQLPKSCAGKEGVGLVDCITENIEKSEDVSRTEQDLTAQQQAAWGSMISAGSAISTVFITIIGLIWIKATLNATQETARAAIDANRISNEQSRGWLAVEILEVGHITKSVMSGDISVRIVYRLSNVGQSPVINLSDTVFAINKTASSIEKKQRLSNSILGRRSSGVILGLTPGESMEREYLAEIKPKDLTVGYIGINPTTVFEIWVGGEYSTRGIDGISASIHKVAAELPLLHSALITWSAAPTSQKVGAILT